MSWENSPPEACSISVTIVEPVAGMSCASTRRVAPVSAGARSQADRNPIPDQYYGNSVQPLPPRSPGASAPPGAAPRPRRQPPLPPLHPQDWSGLGTTPRPPPPAPPPPPPAAPVVFGRAAPPPPPRPPGRSSAGPGGDQRDRAREGRGWHEPGV